MPIPLFINAEEEITVPFFVAESKSTKGLLYCDINKAELIKIGGAEIDAEKIEQHQAVFRVPSYGDNNRIFDSGVKVDEESLQIAPNQIRSERIMTLIKSWTLKNGDKEVAPTRQNVKSLHPIIAMTVGLALESELMARGHL